MEISYDSTGFHVGSRTYVGECINRDFSEIGTTHYDGKVIMYPCGKYQIVKASKPVFRVPVPGAIPKRKIFPFCVDDDVRKQRSEERTDNLHRAKNRMFQIVFSNEWDYFLTLTFDDDKVKADDPVAVLHKTQNWLKNMTKRTGLGYVLVPEYHKKDKRIHFHALCKGKLNLTFDDVYGVEGIKKPVRMSTIKKYHLEEKIKYPVFNCSDWKNGFSTAISVYGSPGRLARYVLKYMTKDMTKIFGKGYWCSKNINLYPDIELYTLPAGDFYETPGREYWTRGAEASYKYINRLGDALEEMAEGEEALEL